MTRAELEHAIRAACDVARDTEVYVFGSQAIGSVSRCAGVTQAVGGGGHRASERDRQVDVIDANLGELSAFHQAFGFYVHGVAIDAAVLPAGWERRAIAVRNANTNGMTGWCVEAHDLAASKLVAFRDKDRDFVRVLIAEELVTPPDQPGFLSMRRRWLRS